MDRKAFDNALKGQCIDIPVLGEVQFKNTKANLADSIPVEAAKGLTEIILTGCGDSYIAAEIAVEVFNHYLKGTNCKTRAVKCIEASRLVNLDNGDKTLVVAVSASGGPARIEETLLRAKKHGCHAMALTNNGESRAAKASSCTLVVGTPEHPDRSPGLRSYYGSLIGLYALAMHIAKIKGVATDEAFDKFEDALSKYNKAYGDMMNYFDDNAFEIAESFKDFKRFEVIGDGSMFRTGEFIAAKYIEVAGVKCTVIDSENYCHVNTFIFERNSIATFILADKDAANKSRVSETLTQTIKEGREVVLIANGELSDYTTETCKFIKLPDNVAGYEFIRYLYDYLPASLAASYHSIHIGEPFFRRREDTFITPEAMTIGSSNVELY